MKSPCLYPQYGNGILHIGNSLALLSEGRDEPPAPTIFDQIRDCDRAESCPMARFTDLSPTAW